MNQGKYIRNSRRKRYQSPLICCSVFSKLNSSFVFFIIIISNFKKRPFKDDRELKRGKSERESRRVDRVVVLKTFFSKEEKRSKTVPRSRIVVNWDSCNCCVLVEFSFDFIVFRKGFVVSQQFPVYLGRFSLNVICLVWFFFCRASCKQQRRDEV